MEYRIDLAGDTSAAKAGAAALREEGAAATAAKAAIDDMRASAAALEANTKAASALASALRDVAKAGTGAHAPFSKAAPDEPFQRSKWDTSLGPTGAPSAQGPAAAGGKALGDAAEKAKKGASASKVAGAAAKESASGIATVGAVAKGAALGLVAYGAALAGIHGARELTQMAIGWRGAAQLQLLSWKATMDLRRAVRGVDPQPLVRAFTSLEKNISGSTVTGKAFSGILTRGFNAIFGGVEKGMPLLERFFQGAVLGALELEEAWLDLRIAAQPLTKAIGELLGSEKGLGSAADIGAASFRVLGAAVEYTAKGLSAVVEAYKYLDERARRAAMPEEEQIRLGNADRDRKEREAREAAQTPHLRDVYTEHEGGKVTKEMFKDGIPVSDRAPEEGARAGSAVGKAVGQGMAQGLDGEGNALSEAGKTAIKNVLKGAKTEGEIHSPSARARREVGRPLGQGAIGGVEDMAPAMQKAGAELIPNLAGAKGAALPGAGNMVFNVSVGPFNVEAKDGADLAEKLLAMAPELGQQILRVVAMRMGLPAPGVA